jgi:3',5'-cyclic AMP phosphodiesterase CpdA
VSHRFSRFLFFAAIAVVLCSTLAAGTYGCSSFAVIGDTRIGLTESVYVKFLRMMDKEGVCFLVLVGDVIDRPGSEKEWARFKELTGPNRRYHIALGNHDANTTRSVGVYRRETGQAPYHSFAEETDQFIILSSEIPGSEGRIGGKQLVWLQGELRKPFRNRFVFVHRPPFPSTFGKGYGLDRFPGDRDQLHRLFVESKVRAVFAGHEHLYNREEKDGIMYVITGGGGARLLTFSEEYGGFYHYVLAKRSNEGYLFTVFDIGGNKRDQFSIKY